MLEGVPIFGRKRLAPLTLEIRKRVLKSLVKVRLPQQITLVLAERVILKEDDLCITSGMSINGRLFLSPREHLDALVSVAEHAEKLLNFVPNY